MSRWHQLTTSALLGTRHQPPNLNGLAPTLQPLLEGSSGPAEHRLLLAAGLQTLYTHVGEQAAPPSPSAHPSRLTKAAESSLPIPEPLKRILTEMLDGNHVGLLPELLDGLHARNIAIPAELLPNLLKSGVHNPRLHLPICRLLDERGHWLAAQNPDWRYAISPTLPLGELRQMWAALTTAKKVRLLELLRQLVPQSANLLLRTEWRRLSDSGRSMVLKALDVALSMADEPFLEAALDDRNANVRRRAAEMLANLPQSRYAQRMLSHHVEIFELKTLLSPAIHIHFPDTLTPAMQRDGITRKTERRKEAYINRRLILMLGATPLDHWTERWETTPETIIQAAINSSWTRTLLTGFANAARRQQRADWGLLLLQGDGFLTSRSTIIRSLQPQHLPALLELAQEQLVGWMPLSRTNPLQVILKEWPHRWPQGIANFYIEQLERHMLADSAKVPDPSLRGQLSRFFQHIPPEMGTAVAAHLRRTIPSDNVWHKTLHAALNLLTFRVTMHQALAASVDPTRGT